MNRQPEKYIFSNNIKGGAKYLNIGTGRRKIKLKKKSPRHGNYILRVGNNKEEIHRTTGPIVLAPSG